MTTHQTHIDAIRAAEEEAARIVADAQKAEQMSIEDARKEAHAAVETYVQSVAQAQEKRLVSQEQQLADAAAKIRTQAEEEAAALTERARAHSDAAAAEIVATLV